MFYTMLDAIAPGPIIAISTIVLLVVIAVIVLLVIGLVSVVRKVRKENACKKPHTEDTHKGS